MRSRTLSIFIREMINTALSVAYLLQLGLLFYGRIMEIDNRCDKFSRLRTIWKVLSISPGILSFLKLFN